MLPTVTAILLESGFHWAISFVPKSPIERDDRRQLTISTAGCNKREGIDRRRLKVRSKHYIRTHTHTIDDNDLKNIFVSFQKPVN